MRLGLRGLRGVAVSAKYPTQPLGGKSAETATPMLLKEFGVVFVLLSSLFFVCFLYYRGQDGSSKSKFFREIGRDLKILLGILCGNADPAQPRNPARGFGIPPALILYLFSD